MDLSTADLCTIKYQEGCWLDFYASGLRKDIERRVRALASRIVPDTFRDDVVADVLVSYYDPRAMDGSLLATWDEASDVLPWIAGWEFIKFRVLDCRNRLCPSEHHSEPLPADLPERPPEGRQVHPKKLVLRRDVEEITQPLIVAGQQLYPLINWASQHHETLRAAIAEAVGPPEPFERLERIRQRCIAGIQAQIDETAAQTLKARNRETRARYEAKLAQLHACATVCPLDRAAIVELLHVSDENAYMLLRRFRARVGEFFCTQEEAQWDQDTL